MRIEYPIEINKIEIDPSSGVFQDIWKDKGKFVAIRPCKKEYGDKTYLGLHLGDIRTHINVHYDPEDKYLILSHSYGNPAIFVFDLNEIIFGYESWWGVIESEKQLKEITNDVIDNVWYVKALKQIDELDKEKK